MSVCTEWRKIKPMLFSVSSANPIYQQTEGQMDRRTDGWKDRWMNRVNPVYPWSIFSGAILCSPNGMLLVTHWCDWWLMADVMSGIYYHGFGCWSFLGHPSIFHQDIVSSRGDSESSCLQRISFNCTWSMIIFCTTSCIFCIIISWPDIFQHYYHISNKYYITKILFQYESKHIINSMNTHELISISFHIHQYLRYCLY